MNIALIIVIIYMISLLAVSWLAAMFQRGNTAEGFLLANKQLPWPLVGVMFAGIAIGGSSTVGIAQKAYTAGISAGWYDVAWAGGAIFTGVFMAKKLRASNYGTVNQMLGCVFGPRFELLSAVIQIIINIVIVALQIVAGGAILTALLPEVFNMPLGILVSAIMFGLIATTGGLLAASLSNVINLCVIYIGIVIGAIAAVNQFGGFEAITMSLPAGLSGDGSHWYHLAKGMGMGTIVAWFVTMLIQGVPNGGVLQNVIAAKTPNDARRGAIFGAMMMIPAGFLSAIFGIIAAGQFPDLKSSALAMPAVVMTLPGWIAGIILAGLWAADISTATGLMVAVSTMFSEDVLFRYLVKSNNRKFRLRLSRLVIALVVVIGYFAATQVSNILGSLMVALSLFAPYAILLTTMFLLPKTVKRSSGWLTFGLGAGTFVVVQFIVPAWQLGGQPIYSVLLASLIGFLLSQFDKRSAPVENLFRAGIAEQEA